MCYIRTAIRKARRKASRKAVTSCAKCADRVHLPRKCCADARVDSPPFEKKVSAKCCANGFAKGFVDVFIKLWEN